MLSAGGPFFGVDVGEGVLFDFAPPGALVAADFFVDFFEHGDAPTAACAGGEAFGDLGGDLGFAQAAEGFDFALGDVEAETDRIVVF